ncbi:MAG: class I SAM-dependent methyltransferase [Verrucomicrobia bacterium]|nr:class I SAM-dependent methyltransferase [Verrucomicrobiota bacterium]
MAEKTPPKLDPALEKYYSEGNEQERLSYYRLEKDRTLQILKKMLPSVPATVLDIGGAAGVYSFVLSELGYEVHLIDPVPLHIMQAKEVEKTCKFKLASSSVGDARQLSQKDRSCDVVLLLGPLYHLIKKEDRNKALQEAYRVLKPGGILFAAGISRFASFIDAMHKNVVTLKSKVIEHELETGVHEKISEGFSFAYLHHPNELKKEIEENKFENVSIRAIEGPVWDKHSLERLIRDEKEWEKVLMFLEKIETEETILGASAHIMAVATK